MNEFQEGGYFTSVKENSPKLEFTVDALVYVFGVIPLFLMLTLGMTCAHFDEGHGAVDCALGGFGTAIAEMVFGYIFTMAIGGFLIIVPVVLTAGMVSIILKMRRYVKWGYFRMLYSAPFLLTYILVIWGFLE